MFSKISKHNYCSRRCAVTVNNSKFIKNPGVAKICHCCGAVYKSREKYCSRKCKDLGESISESELISQIKQFVMKNGRIPFKQEFVHSHAARLRFGSWNKAIVVAGFKPNPVMFSKKHIAKDGHKCDSLAEKLVDDWLFKNGIEHKRSFPYPDNKGFTCDFVIGNKWVEFFGLAGQFKKYDQLKKRKLRLARKHNLKVIEIYPEDVFPLNTNKLIRALSNS